MENIEIGIALVRNSMTRQMKWLARQDRANVGQLRFIIGQRLENEVFRETVIREVAWELGLDRKRDFIVSNMAQMNLDFVGRLPGMFDDANIKVAFYNVEIYRKEVYELIRMDRLNFWVNSEEICSGTTIGGRQFDPVVPYLVNRSSVIQHWESKS